MGKLTVFLNDCINWRLFGLCVLVFSTYMVLHIAIKRRKYSKLIPSKKNRFIDVLGDLSCFCFKESTFNGYSLTTIFLQYAAGFCKLFENERLFVFWISYTPQIILLAPETIEEVIKLSTNVVKKQWVYTLLQCWLRTGLLTSTGKKWKSRRKLLTPAFHFDILRDFLPIINEKSMKLVKKFERESSKEFIDISDFVILCSLDVICETTLGVDINAQENTDSEYIKAVERVSKGLTTRLIKVLSWFDFTFFLTHGRQVKKDIDTLHNFTLSVIREKKKQFMSTGFKRNKRKPLLEVLLEHHLLTNELSDEEIREEVDTFVFEGHDTTAMAMVWTLYLMGLYQDIQLKVQEELDKIFGNDTERPVINDDLKDMNYLECVIKESMRLYPPVAVIGREVEGDMIICGYPVPKGAGIGILPFVLHRNEKIFPDPEVFDPERFTTENSAKRHPFAYIPFSAGVRNCIGQKLAMMEIKTVLANIFRNCTLNSLDHRDKVLPCSQLTTRPSVPVRVKITSRKM